MTPQAQRQYIVELRRYHDVLVAQQKVLSLEIQAVVDAIDNQHHFYPRHIILDFADHVQAMKARLAVLNEV